MKVPHGVSWFGIMSLILIILVLWSVRWAVPKVQDSVQDVKDLMSPSIEVTQTPLTGCAINRLHGGLWWE